MPGSEEVDCRTINTELTEKLLTVPTIDNRIANLVKQALQKLIFTSKRLPDKNAS